MAATRSGPREELNASRSDAKQVALGRALAEATELPGIDAESLTWLQRKISERTFNLVVAGQFKRGKSSVINALLGESLLPAGVIPLTSVVTVIRAGATRSVRVELLDGTSREISLEELPNYVTERGNPNNVKSVRQVVIDHPSSWLVSGLQLVDTPGIGSVYEHNTDITCDYLPQADAVLFIASVEQPLSRAELDFLISIREYAGKVFCLLNKTDHLRREELVESLKFAAEAIHAALGTSVPVFPVSARLALESKLDRVVDIGQSGFVDFENALRHFIAEEGWDVWVRSIARNLLRILSQLRFQLGLEAQVLRTPLREIEQKLEAFDRRRRDFERALVDYQVLMEAGVRALMREDIEPELDQFRRSEQARIAALVETWCAEGSALSTRKLDVDVERRTIQEIRNAYDAWLKLEESKASAAFDRLCARLWQEMQSGVDELMRYSSELFGVTFEPVTAESDWSPESGFYYRFWYEPSGLATLSSALVTMLPKLLARRWVLKRRKAVAVELVEMQAGRLRHDFEERVFHSGQDARRRMVHRIEAILAGIDAAIASGMVAHRRGETEGSAALTRSKRVEQAVLALVTRVRALESSS